MFDTTTCRQAYYISHNNLSVGLLRLTQQPINRPATFHAATCQQVYYVSRNYLSVGLIHTTTCHQACYVLHNNLSIGLFRSTQKPVSRPATFHTTTCQQACYVSHNLPVSLLRFTQAVSTPATSHTFLVPSGLTLLPYHCVSYGMSLYSAIVSVTACPLFLTVVSVTACPIFLTVVSVTACPLFLTVVSVTACGFNISPREWKWLNGSARPYWNIMLV